MGARLFKGTVEKGIPMYTLKKGQLAVIVDLFSNHVGDIVCRAGNNEFVGLGNTGCDYGEECAILVRILQPGELIEVV